MQLSHNTLNKALTKQTQSRLASAHTTRLSRPWAGGVPPQQTCQHTGMQYHLRIQLPCDASLGRLVTAVFASPSHYDCIMQDHMVVRFSQHYLCHLSHSRFFQIILCNTTSGSYTSHCTLISICSELPCSIYLNPDVKVCNTGADAVTQMSSVLQYCTGLLCLL